MSDNGKNGNGASVSGDSGAVSGDSGAVSGDSSSNMSSCSTATADSMKTFTICTKNHVNGLITVFQDFKLDGRFTDCIIFSADAKPIRAHRIVLASRSKYFSKIFQSQQLNSPEPSIAMDIPYEDLNDAINLIYFGAINISNQRVDTYLKVLEKLDIMGLNDPFPTEEKPRGEFLAHLKPPQSKPPQPPADNKKK